MCSYVTLPCRYFTVLYKLLFQLENTNRIKSTKLSIVRINLNKIIPQKLKGYFEISSIEPMTEKYTNFFSYK